ncbi:MAG: ankyrin repeat domain-containing protein [Fimbriimonas sp.]
MRLPIFRLFLPFVFLLAAALAGAQTIPLDTIESIDVRVLNARSVVLGRVVEVTPTSEKDKGLHDVDVEVEETLKGAPQPRLRLNVWALGESLDQWKRWRSERTLLLVDVPTREANPWMLRATGWNVPDQKYITADLRLLHDPAETRGYIREVVRKNPGVGQVETYRLKLPEGPLGEAIRKKLGRPRLYGVEVPVDKRLEQASIKGLGSEDPQVRAESARSLRYFKSPANVARLRALFKDPYYVVVVRSDVPRGIEARHYQVRQAAYDTLTRDWGMTVDPPMREELVDQISTMTSLRLEGRVTAADLNLLQTAKNVTELEIPYVDGLPEGLLATVAATTRLTRLQMPGLSVDDAALGQLASLKELRSLSIARNPITDEGLKTVAGFKNLRELDVTETEVTDAGLDALRRARPDLKVTPAKAVSPMGFYIQSGYLAGLRRILDRTPRAVDGEPRSGQPLHRAAYERQYDAVRLLLDRGASVFALDSRGHNPLHSALIFHRPHIPIVELLIGHGVDVNAPDREGFYPLVRAAQMSNPELIRLLLACGADPFKVTAESLGLARPAPAAMGLIDAFKALKTTPTPIVPTTYAPCGRTAYSLSPEGSLANWTSKSLGEFSAPLQWSRSPLGRPLVGPLGQQSATLRVPSLPSHRNVRVEIDLFLIGSWDGNGGLVDKPDLFDVSVPGTGTLLRSTFDNHDEGDHLGLPMQSFPAPYPLGFHRSFTGASEVRSLGYEQLWNGQTFRRDAVYKLVFTFAHASPELELVLSSLSVTEGEGSLEESERWGIGRVVVKTD